MTTFDHASRLATAWLSVDEPVGWRELEGTAVLADLTGFTRLTEALSHLGPEGTEVLHRSLTLCFSSLLGPSIDAGGDIIAFAGDAALVWFDGDGHVERAVESAMAMPPSLARVPAAVTGGKRLRGSIGVHTGQMTAMLLGSRQRGLVFCGEGISALVALESAAGAGQVVASEAVLAQLPSGRRGAAVGPGFEIKRRSAAGLRRVLRPAVRTAEPHETEPEAAARSLSLLAPPVRAVMVSGERSSEHRSASVGFVAIAHTDEMLRESGVGDVHARLSAAVDTIVRIGDELAVNWLDFDVGIDQIRMMFAAGAPTAVDDDEGRLVVALRRMIDQSELVLRAGAQRGRVFAGALGVPGRRTFTAIGDAVNVAARALGQAKDGELIAGDRMGVAQRPFVLADALGATTLKNRSMPVELWRVRAIEGSPVTGASGPVSSPPAAYDAWAEERNRIGDAWTVASHGPGTALTIVADPGMDATALLRWAAVAAQPGGATITVIDALDAVEMRQRPYGSIDAIVRRLAGSAATGAWLSSAAAPSGLPEDWFAEAADALAEVVHDDIDPMTAARRVRTALAAAIRHLVHGPWLLAIDELERVDEASRSVVDQLVATIDEHTWLFVATCRTATAALVEDPARTITLAPLTDEAAGQFVIGIEPRLRDDQVARIVAAGRGHPFVLAELSGHPTDGELPDSLERLGVARLDALPPRTRRLVREASTFGAVVPLALAADVLERPELVDPDEWTDAVTVLVAGEPGTIVFRHDAYRIAAHDALPFQRRRELHGAIADRIASSDVPSDRILAWHYEEAGRLREAFPLAVAAGRAAQRSGALTDAADHFARAAALARQVDRGARGELLMEQATSLMGLGDLTGAERAFAAAARASSDPATHALLCSHRADLAIRRGQYRAARNWAQKGLTIVGPLGDEADEVRARLLLDDAGALYYQHRFEDSLRLAAEALDHAPSAMAAGLAHLHLEMVHSALLQRTEATTHADAAIETFDAIGHDRYLGEALSNSGLMAVREGRWADALARYRRAAQVLARTGDTTHRAVVELNEGFLLLRQRCWSAAEVLGVRVQRVFDTAEIRVLGAYARLLRGQIATGEGRFDDALVAIDAAREQFVLGGDASMTLDCDVALMERRLRMGDAVGALAIAAPIARQIGVADETVALAFELCRAIALARTGSADDAMNGIAAALARARTQQLPYWIWRSLSALAELEAIGGLAAPAGGGAEQGDLAVNLGIVDT